LSGQLASQEIETEAESGRPEIFQPQKSAKGAERKGKLILCFM
jgi:hypothetical protein